MAGFGLPFMRLGPDIRSDEERELAIQNATIARNTEALNQERKSVAQGGQGREWIEPVWETPAPAAQQTLASTNPFDVLAHNSKLGLDSTLAQNQAKRAELDKQDEPELRTLHELAQLRIQAIQDSPATNEEKQAQLKTEELRAKEQEIKVRAKTRESRTALDAADQEARRKTVEEITARQYGINLIDGFIKDGSMAPDIGKAKQLALAGMKVSSEDFKPQKDPKEIAREQYIQDKREYDDLMGELRNYQRDPKTRRWKTLDDKDQVVGDVAPEGQGHLDELEMRAGALVEPIKQNFRKWHGAAVPAIAPAAVAAASPMAQGLLSRIGKSLSRGFQASAGSSPFTGKMTGSGVAANVAKKNLTREQVVALKNRGMSADQVRQWATETGYAF